MVGQKHEDMCKICNILSPEDIQQFERECLDRRESYTNIGAKYGIKYDVTITKQQVSNHMKWLRERKLDPDRDELLKQERKNMLNTLDEHFKVHIWLWDKIKDLETLKVGASTQEMLKIHNTQDRLIKSVLRGLGLHAEITGEAKRDVRQVEISVALKQLQKEHDMEE